MKKQRIAVLGGSFNPIHNGHLAAAALAKYELEADKILLIPTGRPPHKEGHELASSEDRLAMARLAISGLDGFELLDIEARREGKSYTVDTAEALLEAYPGAALSFVVGTDMFFSLEKWKDIERLFKIAAFAVVARPGYDNTRIQAETDALRAKYNAKIRIIESSGVELSSSDIRYKIRRGVPCSFLLPQAVESYIIDRGLYQSLDGILSAIAGKCPETAERVKSMVSPKRYVHILNVADTAAKLAERYNADAGKTLIAALLHDCAKGWGSSEIDHAGEGARLAEELFGINDVDILDAIRYHTTGRMGMSLLEKIIFVADCIEPTRSQIDEREEVARAAFEDLDCAMYLCLRLKINFTVGVKREAMAGDSVRLYEELGKMYKG